MEVCRLESEGDHSSESAAPHQSWRPELLNSRNWRNCTCRHSVLLKLFLFVLFYKRNKCFWFPLLIVLQIAGFLFISIGTARGWRWQMLWAEPFSLAGVVWLKVLVMFMHYNEGLNKPQMWLWPAAHGTMWGIRNRSDCMQITFGIVYFISLFINNFFFIQIWMLFHKWQ